MKAWFFLFLASVSLVAQAQDYAVGIAICKERPTTADEFATATLFKRVERFSMTSSFYTRGSEPAVILNANIAAIATFDDLLTCDLVNSSDLSLLSAKKTELVNLAARFKAASPLLKAVIERLDKFQTDMEAGQVRFRGGWTTAVAYQSYLKQEALKAESTEKQRKAEIEDKAQRERNLTSRRVTLAGRYLLKNHESYMSSLAKILAEKAGDTDEALRLPDTLTTTATLPLPRHKGREIGLTEGRGIDAPAVLFVMNGKAVRSYRLAVALRMEGEDITNASDLQAALAVLQTSLPDLADALPLCVVTARTRLLFQKGKGGKGETTISREFDGRPCEIFLSEPAFHDDGSLHAILAVTVR